VAAPDQLGENPLAALLCPVAVRRQERALQAEAERALDDLGLHGRAHSTASRVSLGQSKRVAIARAVRAGAKVLFLDEPLAGLDEAGIAGVLAMLQALARDEGLTLVIVEHVFNIPLILDFATTVWTLSEGQMRVEEPEAVRDEVEQHLADGLPAWLQQVAGNGGSITTQPLPGGAALSCVRPTGVPAGSPVLEVDDLIVYRGGRLVIGEAEPDGTVRGVSFTLRQGELSFLQAPNGWGKTTLLEALAGLIPSSGSIRLLGQPLKKHPAWVRQRLGLSLLQARDHTFPGLSVQESLRLSGVASVPAGLERLLSRKVCDLSGGEKQKVAVACALSGNPITALLDEPFLALDAAALRETWHSLQNLLSRCGLLVAVPGGSRVN
jgi:ABC-type multidrug transport system ATPase subunit